MYEQTRCKHCTHAPTHTNTCIHIQTHARHDVTVRRQLHKVTTDSGFSYPAGTTSLWLPASMCAYTHANPQSCTYPRISCADAHVRTHAQNACPVTHAHVHAHAHGSFRMKSCSSSCMKSELFRASFSHACTTSGCQFCTRKPGTHMHPGIYTSICMHVCTLTESISVI